ncbi:MAG: carboxypeptidase regulatory-like domain-containing protein [candidate division Zixibacteria bacterium]|nr:carboxypeptidase regulatory-like domain-containing protein [candidate division Zixibacteria bacterium]
MKQLVLLIGLVIGVFSITAKAQELPADVLIWYGNPDGSPLIVDINDTVLVDVYIQCNENVNLETIQLVLGTDDQYIDSLFGESEGATYPDDPDCGIGAFYTSEASPPNVEGWSSQAFIWMVFHYCPDLHFEEPTKFLSFAMITANDPGIEGHVALCLESGVHSILGGTLVDGGGVGYLTFEEYHSPLYFQPISQETGAIRGTVINSYTGPVEGFHVQAIGTNVEDTTDSDGHFILDDLNPAIHDILFSHPDYVDTVYEYAFVIPMDTTEIEMALRGAVSGIVENSDDELIENVEVSIIGIDKYDTTNSSGEFLIDDLNRGMYDLAFSHPDYSTYTRSDVAIFTDSTSSLDITLLRPGSLAGTVVDQDSIPVEGVRVWLWDTDNEDTTDINGEYYIQNIPPKRHGVYFIHPLYFDKLISFVIGEHENYLDAAIELRPEIDVSARSIIIPMAGMYRDSVYYPSAYVKNYGITDATFDFIFEAYLKNSPLLIHADTIYDQYLESEISGVFEFNNPFIPLEDTSYLCKSYTILPGDERPANDTTARHCYSPPEVVLWYGNLDGSPIIAGQNDTIDIDVFIQSDEEIEDVQLLFSISLDCYGSFLIDQSENYSPLDWIKGFFDGPMASIPGYINLHYFSFADGIYGEGPFTAPEPTQILKFVIITSDDAPSGETVNCLGPGLTWRTQMDFGIHHVYESFSPILFVDTYGYTPGDANGDDNVIGSDVTYLVNYFRSAGGPPPDSCWNMLTEDWHYCAADANGDCLLIGSDVTFMVNYFRGEQPSVLWCEQTPPMEE